jgi:hypothetical protein
MIVSKRTPVLARGGISGARGSIVVAQAVTLPGALPHGLC